MFFFPFCIRGKCFFPPLSDVTHLDEMLGLPTAGGAVRVCICSRGPGFQALLHCPAELLRDLCSGFQRNLRGGALSSKGPWRIIAVLLGANQLWVEAEPPGSAEEAEDVGFYPAFRGPGHEEAAVAALTVRDCGPLLGGQRRCRSGACPSPGL